MIRKPNAVTHCADGTSIIHIRYKGVLFAWVIDTVDYPLVANYCWNIKPDSRTWYVASTSKTIRIQHILVGKGTDHKDGDGLNNRRQNLRPATERQQQFNRRKKQGHWTSTHKGVYRRESKWVAKLNGRWLGTFSTETAAASAYNAAASSEQGEFAVLNQTGG